MEYTPPKLVSMAYNAYPPLPEEHHYWGVTVKIWLNRQDPEVDNHTGPRGRLKWISPIHLTYHDVTPGSDLSRYQSREQKLHRQGWVGMSIYHISPFEERAIKERITALGDQVYPMRPYAWDVDDERPGDIGTFTSRNRCLYFATGEIRADFKAMLDALPKRTVEMYVNRKAITPRCIAALRGLNYMITKGEDADLLTVEERVPSTVLMMVRLAAGVGKPK